MSCDSDFFLQLLKIDDPEVYRDKSGKPVAIVHTFYKLNWKLEAKQLELLHKGIIAAVLARYPGAICVPSSADLWSSIGHYLNFIVQLTPEETAAGLVALDARNAVLATCTFKTTCSCARCLARRSNIKEKVARENSPEAVALRKAKTQYYIDLCEQRLSSLPDCSAYPQARKLLMFGLSYYDNAVKCDACASTKDTKYNIESWADVVGMNFDYVIAFIQDMATIASTISD